MPIFRRSDGDLIRDLPPVRRFMPLLLRSRNEALIFHEQVLDLTRTLPWLEAWNGARPDGPKATFFHLFLWAVGRSLNERPGLNRFVSGGRIYQRRGVQLSFAAKRQFRDDAPFVTVKKEFPGDESFEECVKRLTGAIREGRTGPERPVDKEVRLVTRLPVWLVSAGMTVLRWLDKHNLMPSAMMRTDPMYASLFAANLGSVGIDDTFHHLYEYGTVSLFGVVGAVKPRLFLDAESKPVVRPAVQIRWTFDERINDGFYCFGSLGIAKGILEDPEKALGRPGPVG